jgi:hypothetical protein
VIATVLTDDLLRHYNRVGAIVAIPFGLLAPFLAVWRTSSWRARPGASVLKWKLMRIYIVSLLGFLGWMTAMMVTIWLQVRFS